jgi:hypothetical protein
LSSRCSTPCLLYALLLLLLLESLLPLTTYAALLYHIISVITKIDYNDHAISVCQVSATAWVCSDDVQAVAEQLDYYSSGM